MRRRLSLLWFVAGLTCGCGIQTDSQPRDVPEEKRALRDPDASTANATGAGRVYLVSPGEQHLLRSVPREAVSRQNLMEVLFLGPNGDELSAQYGSAIPPGTGLLSTDSKGNVLVLDVSSDFTDLPLQRLTQALAQIVYTATELEGVQAVELTVDGEPVPWPKGNGSSTTGALRTYDYPGFVQTAQPPYPAVPSDIEPEVSGDSSSASSSASSSDSDV